MQIRFELPAVADAARVKDLASVAGVRDNQLVGYGLVVGLDGTGGGSEFTEQSLRNMLVRLGVRIPPNVNLSPKNVAAVALHADTAAIAAHFDDDGATNAGSVSIFRDVAGSLVPEQTLFADDPAMNAQLGESVA